MGFLKNLLSGGGLVEKGLDFINKRWPPDMSDEQKAQMDLVIKQMLHEQEIELMGAAQADEEQFNQRTKDLEGTAEDLKEVRFLGPLVIFLRGAFRPLFSYATLYFDWVYFTTDTSAWTDRQETLLMAINLLVLVFFYGERATRNVLPVIINLFAQRKA